ncbi:MAG: insulinase family protein [Myxococcales bacterium]|nr:insulinase family protein [Myxococcales bacterium]
METHQWQGLRVLIEPVSTAPVVAIQVWVGVGAADERAGEEGLAHLHEHMLFKGSATRLPGQLALEIESAGGEINAWTSLDQTVYHVVISSRYLELGLDVLADATCRASFPADELAREIEVVLEEIKRSDDHPFRLLSRDCFATLYGSHPYGRPVIGTEASVRSFQRDDLQRFFERWYVLDNIDVVVVGDVDPERVLRAIERSFEGGRRARGPIDRALPALPPRSEPQASYRAAPFRESFLQLAWPIPDLQHEDIPALDLLAVVLGQGESSRLSQRVKRRAAVVNEIYSYAFTPRGEGFFAIGATTAAEQLPAAIRAIELELEQLSDDSAPATELQKARSLLWSDLVYSKETVQGLARKHGFYQSTTGSADFEARYYEALDRVTPSQLREIALRYLRREALTVGVLRPQELDANDPWSTARVIELLGPGKPDGGRSKPTASERRGLELAQLPNGLRVGVLRDTTVPLFAVRAVFLGGSSYETPDLAGANNLAAQLITRGTAARSSEQMARRLDELAGSLDGVSGRHSFGLRGEFLSNNADEALELFGEALNSATFGEPDFSRERELVYEELKNLEDSYGSLVFRIFSAALYAEHPYGREPLGTAESLATLHPEGLRDYVRRQYGSSEMVLLAVGDLEPERLFSWAARTFGGESAGSAAAPEFPAVTRPEGARVAFRQKSSQQAHVALGFPGLRIDDPQRHALEVLTTIISGKGGRLFRELRDKQSLAYSVSAFNIEGVEPGYVAFYGATSPDKLGQLIAGFRHEIVRTIDSLPADDELDRAKRYLIGTHDIGLQRRSSLAATMVFNELYGLGWEHHRSYRDRTDAVSRADVRAIAARLLDPNDFVLAVVGPDPVDNSEIGTI